MEYKVLCKIIKIKVIENPNHFECIKCKINNCINCISYNKIKINISKLIDYDKNKLYNKEQILDIILELMKIFTIIIKNNFLTDIYVVKLYVSHFINCINKNNYQNPVFITFKNKLLKEIDIYTI